MSPSKKSRKPRARDRFYYRHPKTTLFVFTFLSIVAIIAVGEAICYRLMFKELPKPVSERKCDDLGACTMEINFGNGVKAAPVKETVDQFQRRVTPGIPRKSDQFAVFFGCSFTFGEGLNDNETLPYYFSQLHPDYRVYNYGNRGAGPHIMLDRILNPEFNKQVPEKKGIGIYVYMDGHVHRANGTMKNFWTDSQPYFTWDGEGKIVKKKTFETGRPITTFIHQILRHSSILDYFGVDIPPRLRDSHYRIAAAMISTLRDEFKKKFNSDEFYVFFYPGSSEKHGPKLIPFLKEFNVKYFEHFGLDMDKLTGNQARLPDGHPTAKAQKAMAAQLEKDIAQSHLTH